MGLVETEMGFPGSVVQPEAGLAYPRRSILSIASTNRIHGFCEEVGNTYLAAGSSTLADVDADKCDRQILCTNYRKSTIY